MKRLILLVACFLLVGVVAQADMVQNGRQSRPWDQAVSSVKLQSGGTDYTDNTTVLTNQVNTGNNATGNAGYQGLMACDTSNNCRTYYLWIDATDSTNGTKGTIHVASFPNVSLYSSFPYGDWRSNTGFTAGRSI